MPNSAFEESSLLSSLTPVFMTALTRITRSLFVQVREVISVESETMLGRTGLSDKGLGQVS